MGACVSLGSILQNACSSNDNLTSKQIKALKDASINNTNEETYDFVKAKVIKVYDGDTFQIAAFHRGKLIRFTVRLYGVDTPEMDSKDERLHAKAAAAAEFTRTCLLDKIVDIQVITNTRVYDRSSRGRIVKGKYGRLLANVYINGRSLTETLINHDFGIAYFGGSKKG